MSNNWSIESISLVKSTTPPTKEEMEKLLPSSWPPRWEEIERYSGSGSLWIKIGHYSPDSHYAIDEDINVHLLPETPPGIHLSKYDFTADLRITYVQDSEIDILDLNESKSHAEKDLLKTKKLLQKSGGELPEEERYSLEELMNQVSQFVSQVKEIRYLGEKARGISTPGGKTGVFSVSIGSFVLDRCLIGSERYLKPGNTKIHSVKCYATVRAHEKQIVRRVGYKGQLRWTEHGCSYCRPHPPCSTLKAEGFIHREEVEQIIRSIFLRIKREKEKPEKLNARIIREGNKIENPKEKFEVKNGDRIETNKRTQVNLADSIGNKISIGGGSRVKINEPSSFELLIGSLTAFIRKLKVKEKFEVNTATASLAVRGTIFSLWTDGETSSLTVVEGEVEFSDLKGNKVIVKTNQTCICSKEQGLQDPVTLPINLKEQFKGA